MSIVVTVNVKRAESLKISMNLKCVGAVLVVFLTLSTEVQKSESAVSARLLVTSFSYYITKVKRNSHDSFGAVNSRLS